MRKAITPKLKTGQVFGQLTIVEYIREHQKYACDCSCGKRILLACTVVKNRQRSCGCASSAKRKANVAATNFLGLRNDLYRRCRDSAVKKRSYSFDLSFENFDSLIKQNCNYCGIEPQPCRLKFSKGLDCVDYSAFHHHGIDRVNNTIGYQIDNCVACCSTCNIAKGAMSVDEWYAWVARVSHHMLAPKP